MEIEPIGIIAAALGCLGWFAGRAFLSQIFLLSTLLGAAAAIVLTSLGYANIQPAHLLLGFVACAMLLRRNSLSVAARSAGFPREGFWLLLTAVYTVISAVLLPRIFAGATYVFAIARTEVGLGLILNPLAPTSGNITQSIYFIGDVICFFVVYVYVCEPSGMKAIVRAAIVTAAVNLCFAGLDLVTWATHTEGWLSVIRNANYRMLDDATVLGFKRIVGSYPEASTFAYFTLAWFAFCARLWLAGVHARVTGPLAVLSLLTLVMSTSSTAYGATAALLPALFLLCLGQIVTGRASRQALSFVVVTPIVAVTLLVGLRLHQPSWNTLTRMVEGTVINKLSTPSGIERETWNVQALKNFSETDGLGAGVGSVRASSFPIAVLGNVGAFGAVTYAGFIGGVLLGRKDRWRGRYPTACRSAARWACIAQLLGASLSGSYLDLGLPFFIFSAVACAGPVASRARQDSVRQARLPAPAAAE